MPGEEITPKEVGDLGELAVGLFLRLELVAQNVLFPERSRGEFDVSADVPPGPRRVLASTWLIQVKTGYGSEPGGVSDDDKEGLIKRASEQGPSVVPAIGLVELNPEQPRDVLSIVINSVSGDELARFPSENPFDPVRTR